MSTLSVSNITDGTDTVETGYVVNGSAKAWSNHNNASSLRDSFNVSSLSDRGTGKWSINVTSGFNNNDFSPNITCGYEVNATNRETTFEEAFTTTKYGFSTSSGGTYQDVPVTTTSAHGDLA